MSSFNVDEYLAHIGYEGSREPTLETLRQLQWHHLMTVPFENLSIQVGEQIVLQIDALFEKIVRRNRGGFCFELNGLFAELLRRLGFEAGLLSAEVAREKDQFHPPFDHLTLAVELDQSWLVDVGFGDSFRQPLQIGSREIQPQPFRDYRFQTQGGYLHLDERKRAAEWQTQYRFKTDTFALSDFSMRCVYHQTNPASSFVQRRTCTKATPDGRVTLANMKLIQTTLAGDRTEQIIATEPDYAKALNKHFGIQLNRPLNPIAS